MTDLTSSKTNAVKTWDPWKMFNVSAEEMELARKRKAMIQQKKAEFRMIKNNPANIVNRGIGGHILDPGIQRWDAARSTYGTYFRVNKRNTAMFLGTYILPIAGIYAWLMYSVRKRDEQNRRGEIPMKDKCMRAWVFQ